MGNMKHLSCNKCRSEKPDISFMAWANVKYQCADGSDKDVKDFRSVSVSIDDFLEKWEGTLKQFLCHHNRAHFHDSDWDKLWDHISDPAFHAALGRHRLGFVIDFSNSYQHAARPEHMQRFWSTPTTTFLGCALKIAVVNLNDQFFMENGQYIPSREEVLAILQKHGLPPEVCIMHTMITDSPQHNSACAQYFIRKKLMPWIWQYTQGCENAVLIFRADNCHQFKSARVARFVASWREEECSKDTSIISTNSEEKHGKDLVDPEQERNKWLCYKQVTCTPRVLSVSGTAA